MLPEPEKIEKENNKIPPNAPYGGRRPDIIPIDELEKNHSFAK